MPILKVYISDDTEKRLRAIARETGREADELAGVSVDEAALDFFRTRNFRGDPAKKETGQ